MSLKTIPEHEFEEFLREHGCEGRPKGSEFAAYRRSDGHLISGYGVLHSKGRGRSVLEVYKKNFLKALAKISEEENASKEDEQAEEKDDDWRRSDWAKNQERIETEWKESELRDEEDP